ncbi:MAG: hypothetical protein RBU37_20955 [Myxococcota bacterium]|nr:hypothetical protein [Myxococcota bacterium]
MKVPEKIASALPEGFKAQSPVAVVELQATADSRFDFVMLVEFEEELLFFAAEGAAEGNTESAPAVELLESPKLVRVSNTDIALTDARGRKHILRIPADSLATFDELAEAWELTETPQTRRDVQLAQLARRNAWKEMVELIDESEKLETRDNNLLQALSLIQAEDEERALYFLLEECARNDTAADALLESLGEHFFTQERWSLAYLAWSEARTPRALKRIPDVVPQLASLETVHEALLELLVSYLQERVEEDEQNRPLQCRLAYRLAQSGDFEAAFELCEALIESASSQATDPKAKPGQKSRKREASKQGAAHKDFAGLELTALLLYAALDVDGDEQGAQEEAARALLGRLEELEVEDEFLVEQGLRALSRLPAHAEMAELLRRHAASAPSSESRFRATSLAELLDWIQQGKLELAAYWVVAVWVDVSPFSDVLLVHLADLLEDAGKKGLAAAVLAECDEEEYGERAVELAGDENLDDLGQLIAAASIASLSEACKRAPEDAQAAFCLAAAYFLAEDAQAVTEAERVVRLASDWGAAHLLRVFALSQSGAATNRIADAARRGVQAEGSNLALQAELARYESNPKRALEAYALSIEWALYDEELLEAKRNHLRDQSRWQELAEHLELMARHVDEPESLNAVLGELALLLEDRLRDPQRAKQLRQQMAKAPRELQKNQKKSQGRNPLGCVLLAVGVIALFILIAYVLATGA